MIKTINKLIPNEFTGIKKIFSSLNKYISSLFDIGYESNSDRATITVLVISSILLSLASGYTTYNGLLQYTPSFIAILITFGIQGLLFGVSWRIGKLYIMGEINFVMWGIWALTILVSVFFSYTALFDKVYSKTERKSNEVINSVMLGSIILGNIETILDKNIVNLEKNIDLKEYDRWKKKVMNTLGAIHDDAQKKLSILEEEYRELVEKAEYEKDYGGSIYFNQQGRKVVTSNGDGEVYKKLKEDANDFKQNTLEPYRSSFNNIHEEKKVISYNFSQYEITHESTHFIEAYKRIITLTNSLSLKYTIGNNILGDNFSHFIKIREELNTFRNECSNNILDKNSFQQNIINIRNCIRIAKISENQKTNYLIELNIIEKNQDSNTHFFIIVMKQLSELKPLALATLGLAFIIDILILLCSLVASKHTTFLNMKDPKDLLEMKNYPLDITFGTDTEIYEKDTIFIKRIKLILNNGYFELEYAKEGFSMVIEKDKILELNMHKELGTFFTMGLVIPVEEGNKIAFRTKFILWMCEQVSRQNDSISSFEDMKEAFKGKKDE